MEKKVIKTKPAKKKVDLSKLPKIVEIVGLDSKHLSKGKSYTVKKEMAIILINKGAAKLK